MTKAKCFYGAVEIFFRELGRSTHYFQGSREHRPPQPPWEPRLFERVIINFQALTDRANHWGNWLKDNSFLMYEPVSDWTARTVQAARIMAHIMFLLNWQLITI